MDLANIGLTVLPQCSFKDVFGRRVLPRKIVLPLVFTHLVNAEKGIVNMKSHSEDLAKDAELGRTTALPAAGLHHDFVVFRKPAAQHTEDARNFSRAMRMKHIPIDSEKTSEYANPVPQRQKTAHENRCISPPERDLPDSLFSDFGVNMGPNPPDVRIPQTRLDHSPRQGSFE